MGHASRMKALADALAVRGAVVRFVTRTPALAAFVSPVHVWDVADGVSEEEAIGDEGVWEHGHPADVVILDKKYPYQPEWLRSVRRRVKVVRIDHPHAEADTADLVVIPNMHQPIIETAALIRACPDSVLSGPDYVMIPCDTPRQDHDADTVLFLTGGSDPSGLMEQWFDWTHRMVVPGCQSFVYARGRMAAGHTPWPPSSWGGNPAGHDIQVCQFNRALYRRARLAVSLFGGTTYELLHAGVPTLSVAQTGENLRGQLELARCTRNLVVSCGHVRDVASPDDWRQMVRCGWDDTDWHGRVRQEGPTLIDGQGIARVADEIVRRCGSWRGGRAR